MMNFLSGLWLGITTAFRGVPATMSVSAIAVVIGLILGFLLAFMRMSKIGVLRGISLVYTDIVRGTPLVVQLFILAYGVPVLVQYFGNEFKWPYLVIPAIIVCGLNSAAYMAEIIRGGLQAVDKGQLEAAASLGMTHKQSMRLVVVPQAVRIILPSLGNEFVTMIKETSVLSFAGVVEIMREGVLLSSRTFDPFTAYIGVAIVYLVFTIPLSKLVLYMERKMAK
ncbi:MAG: amino acid ABC transporter permease [Anaerovoracaceae bacterium]|jgi:His/Glu/Gln/Arg/opine family amino acid ABC transporter permease subunit